MVRGVVANQAGSLVKASCQSRSPEPIARRTRSPMESEDLILGRERLREFSCFAGRDNRLRGSAAEGGKIRKRFVIVF